MKLVVTFKFLHGVEPPSLCDLLSAYKHLCLFCSVGCSHLFPFHNWQTGLHFLCPAFWSDIQPFLKIALPLHPYFLVSRHCSSTVHSVPDCPSSLHSSPLLIRTNTPAADPAVFSTLACYPDVNGAVQLQDEIVLVIHSNYP